MGALARMIAAGLAWIGGAKVLGDVTDLGQLLFGGSDEDRPSSITWGQAAILGAAAFGVYAAYQRLT
jgi:hypothetical protein